MEGVVQDPGGSVACLRLLELQGAGGARLAAWSFGGINLSRAVGAATEAVEGNRRWVAGCMGLEGVQWLRQVHSARVVAVEGPVSPEPKADGAWTVERGLGIGVLHADCIALVLMDPERLAVANLHCGWRGVAAGMVEAGVSALAHGCGSSPATLWAALAPAIGPCCYQFLGWRQLLPEWMWRFVQGDHLDLPAAVIHRLQGCGVPETQILAPPACTRCDARFFSHRRDGSVGRNGTVVAIL